MSAQEVIAAVYAHPDDGEFFAAGALSRWAAEGHKVYAICATSGDLGTRRRDVERAALSAARAAELIQAQVVLGAEPPILLGYPDGALREHGAALRERLIYLFRALRVTRVVTFDPWRRYEIHPDHIEVGRMASEAAAFSGFPLQHPEHLRGSPSAPVEPWQPREVWYMMPTDHRPNRLVDITGTFDRKVAALLCHSSQIEMLAGWFVPGADPTRLTDEERGRLAAGARGFLEGMARGMAALSPRAGTPALAEAFYALRVGPGHFENYQEMFLELAGAGPGPIEVV